MAKTTFQKMGSSFRKRTLRLETRLGILNSYKLVPSVLTYCSETWTISTRGSSGGSRNVVPTTDAAHILDRS